MPERAGHAAGERRAVGLAGILDHDEAMAPGDLPDPVHVGHQPEQVYDADRLRPRGDRGLDRPGVDEVRPGLDVDEDRAGAGEQDRVRGGGEGVADGDHLVARVKVRRWVR